MSQSPISTMLNRDNKSSKDLIRNKYSLKSMAMGDTALSTNTLFSQLNKKLEEHEDLLEDYKIFKREKDKNKALKVPEEFRHISLKICVHQSLRAMLEEIIQTNETHYKKNYLARVNQWYKQKLKLIDEKE